MLIQGIEPSTRVNVRCDIHTNRRQYSVPKHVHHFAELVLILEGNLTVTVNEKKETAEKNQFILLFPFQKHEYESEQTSSFLICTFPLSLLSDFAVKASGNQGERLVFDASPMTIELFRKKIIDPEQISSYGVYCALYAMLEDFTSQVDLVKSNTDNSAMDKLVYYVNQNYKDPLPLHSVAQALGYTPNYLSHCMLKTLGMNYRTFLGSTRAEHAKLMLKTNQSVLEVALECGYPNVRSFQRHFKSLVGISPSDYRKQKKASESNTQTAITKQLYRVRKDVLM